MTKTLLIEAFRVNHPDWHYAYGYRVTHRNQRIVMSGDKAVSPGIKRHAQGVDILIHEAVNTSLMKIIAAARQVLYCRYK